MQKLYWEVRRFFLREEGATMVEYGLMVALIAIVCLSAVTLLGTNVNAVFNQIAAAV
jgi:pilus assembly protein Flp/PilA